MNKIYLNTITLGTETEAVALDITTLTDATLYITITKIGDTVYCGEIVIGNKYDIGTLLYAPTVGVVDYSVKTVDSFGNYTITERAYSSTATFDLMVRNTAIDSLFNKIAEIRATPVVWVGDDTYSSLIVFGFYKEFALVIPYKDYSTYSLDIEGLI
jgi:hypothetical protein